MDFTPFPEYDNHQDVVPLRDDASGLRGFIAVHRGSEAMPAFGATRLWRYESEEDALRDALRLSRGMSYKSALAGLQYGGGKAVLIEPSGEYDKKTLLDAYVKKVNELGGRFITGSDVGLSQEDVSFMKERSPYIVGTTCDPSYYTALGIIAGMRAALNSIFGNDSFEGRSVAIQGVGKIGTEILKLIHKEAKEIFIADINKEALRGTLGAFQNVQIVSPEEIYKISADIFAPCALGGALNEKTVPELSAKIIAGGANNQLAIPEMGAALFEKEILYAPDYVINAGGLISVVDEYDNDGIDDTRVKEKVSHIGATLTKIFEKSRQENRPTGAVADDMARGIVEGNR